VKLIVRILLSLLSVAGLLAVVWSVLPWLLVGFATRQMESRGYDDVRFGELTIGLEQTALRSLHFRSDGMIVDVRDIMLRHEPARLLSADLDAIEIDELSVTTSATQASGGGLPALDIAWLAGLLTTPWHGYLPADRIGLKSVILRNETTQRSSHASVALIREQQTLLARIDATDDAGRRYRASLDLTAEGILTIRLADDDDGHTTTPLSVTATPDPAEGTISAVYASDLSALARIMPIIPGTLRGQLDGTLVVTERRDSGRTGFRLDTRITDAGLNDYAARSIELDAAGDIAVENANTTIRFDGTSTVRAGEASLFGIEIAQATLTLPEVIRATAAGLDGENGALRLADIRQDDMTIAQAELTRLGFAYSPEADAEQPAFTAHFDMAVPRLSHDDISISVPTSTVKLAVPGNEAVRIDAETPTVTIDTTEAGVALEQCETHMRLPEDRVLSDFQCTLQMPRTSLGARLDYNLSTEKGDITFNTGQASPSTDAPLLISLLKGWNEPYDLVSGNIAVSGKYGWDPKRQSLITDIDIRDASGFYEDILFSGLNYSGRIELLPDIRTHKPAEVRIADIDIGVPITDATARLSLRTPRNKVLPVVVITRLRMRLLEGVISGKTILYDLNTEQNEIMLEISGLDLARLVELQQVDGLRASGILDGRLPIFIDQAGIEIRDGEIHARPPGGRIQYVPEGGSVGMGQAAPGADLVFQILEDLQYHSLEATANYTPDGKLLVSLSIKGRSPRLDTQRPVHINLNLEQNVLQLLESLRVADDIDELLDRNAQRLF